MADLCVEYSFAGLTINEQDQVNGLVLTEDGVTGLDGRPIRRQVDPRGQTNGGLVFEAFFGPRVITFKGIVNIVTPDWPGAVSTAYASAIMTVEDAVKSALEGVLNTPTNLTWTQSNGASGSVSCVYGMPGGELQFGGGMQWPTFQFTLVEAASII